MTRLLWGLPLTVLMSAPLLAQAPPPPAAAAVPAPTLASAEKMLAAARAKAAEMGVGLSCAVVDVHGDLVALARMDGVAFLTATVAPGKARASAFTGQPSGGLGERGPVFQSIGAAAGQTVLAVQGAVPIVQGGKRLGGIGCSGGTGQQDEDAAKAGLAAGN
jgi:uncharacterized protein GlcG (DUF336 family)